MRAGGVSSVCFFSGPDCSAGARPICRSASRRVATGSPMTNFVSRRRVRVGALALAAWLGLGAAALAAEAGTAAPSPANTGPVLEVAVRDLPQTIVAEGVVEAIKQTTLGAQV